jgi:hypothetical protein
MNQKRAHVAPKVPLVRAYPQSYLGDFMRDLREDDALHDSAQAEDGAQTGNVAQPENKKSRARAHPGR